LWNPYATTFPYVNLVDLYPYDIFVDINNTVYVANQANSRILMWFEENINATTTISGNLSSPFALFVTSAGDIYVDNGYANGRVDEWAMDANTSVPAMYICQQCYDLFVDISNTLYCSMYNSHQVVSKSLNSVSNALTIVAGTGAAGSTANALYCPYGIFVDINFDLYVADANNNRIQLFSLGQSNAKTVAGNGALGTVTLSWPTGVVLDADNYLFIVDQNNHRIVGSGPNGFQCLVGCYGGGSASYQLYYPQSMAFDSYGNIFVADRSNNRIQKFVLDTKFCGKHK
jgi:sugar lactone lactonase YvrE